MSKDEKKLWTALSGALREIADDIDKAKTNYELIELAREVMGTGHSIGCLACLVLGVDARKKGGRKSNKS